MLPHCCCVCPRPCVTLLPLMSPFTLQSNLLNTTHTHTRVRGDAGTRDAASDPLAISPMESNTHAHTLSHPHASHHPYRHTFFKILALTASPTYQSLFCCHTHIQPPTPSIPPQCILNRMIFAILPSNL